MLPSEEIMLPVSGWLASSLMILSNIWMSVCIAEVWLAGGGGLVSEYLVGEGSVGSGIV